MTYSSALRRARACTSVALLAIGACASTEPADELPPVMSPVLFAAIDESDPYNTKTGVYTILPDGTGLRELWSETTSGYTTALVSLSPDGKRAAFTRFFNAALRVVDLGTGTITDHPVPLSPPFYFIQHLRWHPDSRRIGFAECSGCPIRLLDAETGVLSTAPSLGDLDWSADGRLGAFVEQDQAGVSQVQVMALDAQQPLTLTSLDTDAYVPRWSPDAGTLLFLTNQGLWTVPANGGGEATRISLASGVVGEFRSVSAAWSPDGRHLAFTRLGRLTLARPDGQGQIRIVTPGWVSSVDW